MNRTGQVEFVVLAGLIAMIAVFIVLLYQAGLLGVSPVPQNVAQEQKQVEESIRTLIRQGTAVTLREMERQGGTLETAALSTRFAQTDVAYWQQCENVHYPSHETLIQRFNEGLTAYLNANKDGVVSAGREVSIGDAQVTSQLHQSKIDVTVTMPTTVRGFAIRQPYVVSVETRLGELYDFGVAFAEAASRERYLENFMLITMYQSEEVPTIGLLTSCGEHIFKTRSDLARLLEEAVAYTLTNTVWWELPVVQQDQLVYFGIDSLQGQRFVDLQPRFLLPDGFTIQTTNPVSINNNRRLSTLFPFLLFECAITYNVDYDVTYPVIVNVRDDLLGSDFNFAALVGIEDNLPASCGAVSLEVSDSCESLQCTAHIAVEGSTGPLEGVQATFGTCDVGASGPDGIIEGPIQCGEHALSLFLDDRHEFIVENVTADALSDARYILDQKSNMTVRFSSVEIRRTLAPPAPATCNVAGAVQAGAFAEDPVSGQRMPTYAFLAFSGEAGEFSITNIAASEESGVGCAPSAQCLETGEGCETDAAACGVAETADVVQVDTIPAGVYTVEGYSIVPEDVTIGDGESAIDAGTLAGAFTATVVITEGTMEMAVTMPYFIETVVGPPLTQTLGVQDLEEDRACIDAAFAAEAVDPLTVQEGA